MLSQTNKIRLAVTGIFLIALFTAVINFPQTFQKTGIPIPAVLNLPFRLGLDLQGGTHLIYEADVSQIPVNEQADAVEGVRDVIERRVNSFGVAEPLIQTTQTNNQYRIIVELAGITDVNEAIQMIGETPLLEFKEINPNPQIELTEEQKVEIETLNAQAKITAEEILVEANKLGADFSAIAKAKSQEEIAKQSGGEIGFLPKGLLAETFEKTCFDDLTDGQTAKTVTQTKFGYHIIKRLATQQIENQEQVNCAHVLVKTVSEIDYLDPNSQWMNTGLSGQQLKRSSIQFDPNTQVPHIALEFNDDGKTLFADITQRNVGQPVGIFLDGQAISTPTVQQVITDGQAVITGNFSLNEAKLLAQRLNAGALPVPIKLISQQTIGASLGASSLEKSLQAGLLGLLAVSLFMILFYRLPGLIAVFALMVYGLLTLAVFKIIPVTLTLAGTAGFILSIGMAVDANILIFERLREELREGNPLSVAINKAFERAWPSIFDGNISTLITCFILMGFTTSVVKGFAVTLTIGILVSMFTAMVVTKSLMKLAIQIPPLKNFWLFGLKKK